MVRPEKSSFTFNDVYLAPNEQIGLHQQPTWELSYIINGSGTRLIGDITEPFFSEEVIMIPPEIPHCWYFNSQVTDSQGKINNITITFSTELIDGLCLLFPDTATQLKKLKEKQDAIKFDKKVSFEIIKIIKKMRVQSSIHHIVPIIELLLLISENNNEQVISTYQKTNKTTNRMNQIQTYIVCNAKKTITLDEIAKHIGMNRTSFCIFFKKTTGKSFITYLNEYRVEQACLLLKDRDKNISEICYSVGFQNTPYFNRIFKKIKGVTPQMYREE